jgi:ABC-type multidrug transport system permease subunit
MHIGFASWQDHVAWIMCEFDSKWCNKVANSLVPNDPLKTAIRYKYYEGEDPSSTRAARRICFVVTLANSVPSLIAVMLLLSLLPSAVAVCVSGIQFVSNTLFSFVIFVHGDG